MKKYVIDKIQTDEYSLYAFSAILNDEILIEFEQVVDYKIGDRLFIPFTEFSCCWLAFG